MRRRKIVLWRPMYDSAGAALLEAAGAEVEVVDSSESAEVATALPGADALWVRTPERVTEGLLEAADRLAVISTSGFGTDNIPIEAATRRGIVVVNYPGFGRIPVAEHTLMLLLAAAKQLRWADGATRDGSAWSQRSDIKLFELQEKTVGIVGLGYIGAELARKLRLAFSCRVLAYDPYVDPRIPLTAGAERVDSLPALLKEARFLCICPELTEETAGLIGLDELRQLPPEAIVVNTSRGRVLDLDALAAALDEGAVLRAALDVAHPEPLPAGHPLLDHPDVLWSPHTAGLSVETAARLARAAAQQILAVLDGERPTYIVNPEVLDAPAAGAGSGR